MTKTPYVSDIQAWGNIFKTVRRKKRTRNQSGRGISKRHRRNTVFYSHSSKSVPAVIEQVSPTVAVEERAASDQNLQKKENEPRISPKDTGIKAKIPRKNYTRSKNVKRLIPIKRTRKGNRDKRIKQKTVDKGRDKWNSIYPKTYSIRRRRRNNGLS